MAYVNVLDWKAEQVADWLRGLDDVVYPYAHFFLNNDVTGQGLLNLTVDDLYKLHVEKLGHQEIILEGLELLKNFHYNLDQENLQYICLRLSCKARSLYNEMSMNLPKVGEKQVVNAQVMSSVAEVLESVRLLLSWLERKPFDSTPDYLAVRTELIGFSLEMATNAQRDTFAEQPMDVIRSCCDKLAMLADKVIQQFTDPLILQPASLDVATVRKRSDEELGIVLEPLAHGVHLVSETRMLSPAARVVPGDEIVQVNYQTVVGWQTKKVLQLMCENPVELILTLKKRPRHSNLGQIYMKPFRIPARKKSAYYINNLPSPRTELLVVPDVSLPIAKKRIPSETSSDTGPLSETEDSEDDEAFLPVVASQVADHLTDAIRQSNTSPTQSLRSVLSRPRSAPQRRATISGTSPSHFRPYINVSEIWSGLCDTNVDFPSSTLSSKDSGVSTLSKQAGDCEQGENDEVPELRKDKRLKGGQRPVTAMPSVTSAPNLLRHSEIEENMKKPNRKDAPGKSNVMKDDILNGEKGTSQVHTANKEESIRIDENNKAEVFVKQSINNHYESNNDSLLDDSHTSTMESQKSIITHVVMKPMKPRMPDPPVTTVITTTEPLHVSRIHVTGPNVTHVATNPTYMNVPKPNHIHEYVNIDGKEVGVQGFNHEYVNIPNSSPYDINLMSSPNRQPMPKPRSSGRSFLTESPGGFTGKGSHQNDQQSKQHDILSHEHSELSKSPHQGSNSTTGTFSRGKKPVPLPRRLSTISNGEQSAETFQPETPRKNTPSTGYKAESSADSKIEVKTPAASSDGRRSHRTSVSSPSQTPNNTSSRRRSSTVELPAPTANYKSYRRVVQPSSASKEQTRRSSCTEESQGSGGRQQPVRRQSSDNSPSVNKSKSKSMTRLNFENTKNAHPRTDSGLGLGSNFPSVSSEDSLRLSSVSSIDSGNYSCQSNVSQFPSGIRASNHSQQHRADFIRKSASNNASQSPKKAMMPPPQNQRIVNSPHSKNGRNNHKQELIEAEKRSKRRSGQNFDYPEYEQI